MRYKRHEPIPRENLDEPFGPSPEAYRYRCPVCSEERLVNEAIIDVAIGAATCRSVYQGHADDGVPGMQRRDHGIRCSRAIVRPKGVCLRLYVFT